MRIDDFYCVSGDDTFHLDRLNVADVYSIVINFRFSDCIGNLLTFCIHIQLSPLAAPVAILVRHDRPGILIDFLGFTLSSTRNRTCQCNEDLRRPFAILVISVIPLLGNLDLSLFGCIAVRQRSNGSSLMGVFQAVAFRQSCFIFNPGVFDQFTIGIFRQFFDCCLPSIVLVQRYNITGIHAVCLEFDA